MKKIFLIALLILTGQLFADEFNISRFTYNPDSKIAVRYPRLDQNKQACALILIETKLRDIVFESDQAIIGDIKLRQGRFYLYVQASATSLKFSKDGFDVLEYKLPLSLIPSNVYVLKLDAIIQDTSEELQASDTLVKK